MDYKEVLNEIIPLYNKYTRYKKRLKAIEKIEIMWDIGYELEKYINKYKIEPHKLYRLIYGKSEGNIDVTQKSYISREFQGRCYRIKKIFSEKSKIQEKLPNLSLYTHFREAMPFFDNPKYRLNNNEMKQLLELLNSNKKNKIISEGISKLQNRIIGIKNPRDQRLNELTEDKNKFIKFYNYLYNIISNNDYKVALEITKNIDIDYKLTLAKNTSALTHEGLKFYPFDVNIKIEQIWIDYSETLKKLITPKNEKIRRRFRRLVSPLKIARLSEMLFAFESSYNFKSFKDK